MLNASDMIKAVAKPSRFGAIAVLGVVFATHALADPATPQRTTATYGDWVERCEIQGAKKLCEIDQAMEIRGQTRPVTQIAIGQTSKGSATKIVFQVPINVWLRAGVALTLNAKSASITAQYTRCVPAACLADTDLTPAQIKALRAAKKNGKLKFKDAMQRAIIIPISFKGFNEAYEAMQQPQTHKPQEHKPHAHKP